MPSVTRRTRSIVEDDPSSSMEERLLGALERRLAAGASITAISVDALAREAGIARATFYLHFRDKGDLIARLIARVEDEVVGAGGLWFDRAEDATYADLREALQRFLAVYRKHHAILSAAAETASYDAEVAALYQRMLNRFVGESRRAIGRIDERGRARPGLPGMLAEALSWSVNHCYVTYGTSLPAAQQDELVDALAHVVWYAIFGEPKAERLKRKT